jgi:proliferating cell nuclear antigen PCNA
MFKATLGKVSLLTDSIATIAELIEEGIFKIDKSGISLVAADRAMVVVVDFKISSSVFDKYEIDKDQAVGLNIPNLLSVLKRSSAGDKATLDLKDSKLEIILESASRRRFMIPILDLSQEEIPPIDQLEFGTSATLKPHILQSGIDDAEVVSDSVLFEASQNKFVMKAEGDISSAQLELDKGSESLLDMKVDGVVRARYPVDYLKKIVKATKIADSVLLEWGQDYPMKLAFKAADKVLLSFILAPRVSEE